VPLIGQLSEDSAENASRHYGPLENAQQQKSEVILTVTKARRIHVPAYSPDLPPSDFFLFGMLKERISGTSSSSPDELISVISELIASIPKDQLVSVYKT
jgi:hypothetical protein